MPNSKINNPINISENEWEQMILNSSSSFDKAYAPYSNFKVGAAGITSTGLMIQGCNVENASYGLTVCAERNCIAQAVINHDESEKLVLNALVVFTKETKLTPPCGACRQVIAEFFEPSAVIMAANHLGNQKQWSVSQLLPDAFSPNDLLDK